MHGLPTEIIVLIFEHGGRATLHSDGLPFAVVVSQVSREWRRIAIGTPSVWCSVPVHPLRPSLTSSYLEKSAQLPLDVCLHFKKPFMAQDAMSLLLEERHRWKSLSLRAGSGAEVFLVISNLKNIAESLTQLQHFGLYVFGKPGTVGQLPELFSGRRPRTLRSITLQGVSFDLRSSIFTGLTHLDLASLPRNMGKPTYGNFKDLFSSTSKLKHLRLADVFPKLIDGIEYGEVDFPSLTTLEIVMQKDDDYVPLFFSIICAPALQTLRFESDWSITWDGFELAVPIMSAKFAGLKKLQLSIRMAEPAADDSAICPEFFACFSELRVLSLSALHDRWILNYILKPWIAVIGAEDGLPMFEQEVLPELELLAVCAPFDDNEEDLEVMEDILDLLGSARLSCGQPFDLLHQPICSEIIS